MKSVAIAHEKFQRHPKSTRHHVRVRRGNLQDAEQLRQKLLDAALALFVSGDLKAVSMRAIAQRVGVSTMASYRYFSNKAELLSGLWQFVLAAVYMQMNDAVEQAEGARERQRACIDAFLNYWESNPSHYRLVYMTETPMQVEQKEFLAHAPVYAELTALVQGLTAGLAQEIGADLTHAKLAGDMRLVMQLGYLHSTLVNRRFPWTDKDHLRAPYIEQIIDTVERVLKHGPAV